MFEVDYPPKRYRHFAFQLLKIVTIICIINSILLLFVKAKAYFLFAFIFPLANSAISNVIFGIYIILNIKMHHKADNSLYIMKKFPSIWKKIHPMGKYSSSSIAYWRFVKGKYDDGQDKELEAIKTNENEKLHFFIWVNLLSLVSWMLNLLFIFINRLIWQRF